MKRLIALLLLLATFNANGAISVVQAVAANTGSGSSATLTWTTSATTAGNYLAIAVASSGNSVAKRITTPTGGTDFIGGVIARDWNATGTLFVEIFLFRIINGGQTTVVLSTVAGVGIAQAGILREYSVSSGSFLVPDVWARSGGGTSATVPSGTTATTTSATELWIAAMGVRGQYASPGSSSWATSPTNSFTDVLQTSSFVNTANNDRAIDMLEKFVTSTGTADVTVTNGVSQSYATTIVCLKEISQVVSQMGGD